MQLSKESLADNRGVIITVSTPHLDASNTEVFRNAISPMLDMQGTVCLDLSQVEFIDSSGLGALLSCLRQVNGRRGELRLFGLAKPVQALFELVRMHRLFAIYPSREEALATLP